MKLWGPICFTCLDSMRYSFSSLGCHWSHVATLLRISELAFPVGHLLPNAIAEPWVVCWLSQYSPGFKDFVSLKTGHGQFCKGLSEVSFSITMAKCPFPLFAYAKFFEWTAARRVPRFKVILPPFTFCYKVWGERLLTLKSGKRPRVPQRAI